MLDVPAGRCMYRYVRRRRRRTVPVPAPAEMDTPGPGRDLYSIRRQRALPDLQNECMRGTGGTYGRRPRHVYVVYVRADVQCCRRPMPVQVQHLDSRPRNRRVDGDDRRTRTYASSCMPFETDVPPVRASVRVCKYTYCSSIPYLLCSWRERVVSWRAMAR